MNLEILTDGTTVEIVAGVVVGILSFIFGYKRIKKNRKDKNNNSDDKNKFNNIKIL